MPDEKKDLIIITDDTNADLDTAAVAAGLVPLIGSVASSILSGLSSDRKFERVRTALNELATELKDLKSEASERYVKTEEFEELLEQTMRRVLNERNEWKRRIYRDYLIDAIKSPGEKYDEQIRFLKTLEEVSGDHLSVLKALLQKPDKDELDLPMSSQLQTLEKRLPDMSEAQIREFCIQLKDMKIANLGSIVTMMTGRGAADLRGTLTPYGKHFVKYLRED